MIHEKFLCAAFCLFAILSSSSCKQKAESQTPTTEQNGSTIIYPMTKNFPLDVPVTVNGKTYHFFLDTGCSTSMFNISHRQLLGEYIKTTTGTGSWMQEMHNDIYNTNSD